MQPRRTMIGLCLLCALAVSALAAQGAAASNGTTAFTCKAVTGSPGTTGFKDAHCKEPESGTNVKFEHFAVAEGTTTEISGTNGKTSSNTAAPTTVVMHNVQGGIEYEIQAQSVSGIGSFTNGKSETGEHYIHGTLKVTLEEVVVTKPSGCSIESGTIVSKELTATTLGQGDQVKFQPKEGTLFTEYNVVGASCPEAIKGNYKTSGSVLCPLEGATVSCSRTGTTEQGTFKERNVKTGIEGKLTLSAKDSVAGDKEFTPVSGTTISTP